MNKTKRTLNTTAPTNGFLRVSKPQSGVHVMGLIHQVEPHFVIALEHRGNPSPEVSESLYCCFTATRSNDGRVLPASIVVRLDGNMHSPRLQCETGKASNTKMSKRLSESVGKTAELRMKGILTIKSSILLWTIWIWFNRTKIKTMCANSRRINGNTKQYSQTCNTRQEKREWTDKVSNTCRK